MKRLDNFLNITCLATTENLDLYIYYSHMSPNNKPINIDINTQLDMLIGSKIKENPDKEYHMRIIATFIKIQKHPIGSTLDHEDYIQLQQSVEKLKDIILCLTSNKNKQLYKRALLDLNRYRKKYTDLINSAIILPDNTPILQLINNALQAFLNQFRTTNRVKLADIKHLEIVLRPDKETVQSLDKKLNKNGIYTTESRDYYIQHTMEKSEQ